MHLFNGIGVHFLRQLQQIIKITRSGLSSNEALSPRLKTSQCGRLRMRACVRACVCVSMGADCVQLDANSAVLVNMKGEHNHHHTKHGSFHKNTISPQTEQRETNSF